MAEKKDQDINYEEENNESDEVDVKNKLKKLKEQLKQYQQEKQDNLTGWQRAQADFINYRRRQEEQMGEWSKMFGEGLLQDILPVLDSLESGIRNQESGKEKVEDLRLVREQLMKVLAKHGLMEMKVIGEKFNPELHEAIETVEAEKTEEGVVVAEVQKGYLLNGKVIRVAKVKVTK
mgnify:CR=1 FL=1